MVAQQRREPAGFGLVEVIVAMTLLSICVMSVASGAAFSTAVLRRAEEMEGASRAAESVLDSVKRGMAAGRGAVDRDNYHVRWEQDRVALSVAVSLRSDSAHVIFTIGALSTPALDTVPCVTCQSP
jgi:prepilin-type N-terminal cleavage/methylation domain-containing protein